MQIKRVSYNFWMMLPRRILTGSEVEQMKAKHGRVKYGGRAFHQDATEAMGGDIVRALIETITNSDDAYSSNPGKIRIEIEHRHGPWKVITRDRARGMRAGFMEEAIASLGERTSGFEEGNDVRGNLGRGAKDIAAFGPVDFESICDGQYAHMLLEPDGNYTLDPPRKVSPEDRERLGIPRANGTMVTIHAKENIRCPQHAKLVAKLSRHYQLRDIMADPNREVTLVDLNTDTSDILHFSFSALPVVHETDMLIEGYPEATARLTIFRNAERFDDPPSDPQRPAGILIKGRRAIYENTLFRFETNPYAGWFSGRLECPYIDDRAREYDRRLLAREKQDEQNPIPIITRRRDGLQRAHPFYKALATAVEACLGPLVAEEEKKSQEQVSTESTRLRKMLDGLGRDLSKLIDEDLRAIDEEGLLGSDVPGSNFPPIRLVPGEVVLYMGEDKTVSVIVVPALCASDVVVQCEPAGVVEILDGASVSLTPHRRRPDLLTGQIHLRPLLEDLTLLTVRCGDHTAEALVEVRFEREIIEVESQPVDHLQFERDNYRIAWTRKKTIRILAPLADIAEQGTDASVSSSDPGIVIRKGRVKFSLDEEVEHYVAEVIVEARILSSQATLTAKLGDLTTTCKVVVTKEEEGPSIRIRIVDKEAGHYRAIDEQEGSQKFISIMGYHPIMKRYRGPARPNTTPSVYPGDDLPTTQLLVAEIVANQVVRMILEKKYPTLAHEQIDAARLYNEHYRYMTKYLTRCHRALLFDTELAQLNTDLVPLQPSPPPPLPS
jgi:hypothetical protein